MNRPSKPGTSRGPPVTRSAPLLIASSTSSVTASAWSAETIGPISVCQLIGSPTVSRSVSRTTPSRNRSATVSTTYVRSIPEQVWPALANPPQTQPETAFARSASAHTICGSLPPSSRTEPLSCCAQISPTFRPTSTEPVKKTLPTRGDSQIA